MSQWWKAGIVVLVGCAAREAAMEDAAFNPGQTAFESSTYDGSAFVPAGDDLVFSDGETSYNLIGQAFEGPGADTQTQLGMVNGMTGFWFAWSVHHPGARIWNNGINNPSASIVGNSECGVPCDEIRRGCGGGLDCIPSIDSPDWTTADDTARLRYLTDDDRILGLYNGVAARAYPLDALWTHEIVNDNWAGWEFAVTYCPLTGSGILVDGVQGGVDMEFGVSGLLYNSNLVMYDRTTDSLYGQMRLVGISGERLGESLDTRGVLDTTWGQWREMFPDTEVLSDRNGISGYPYGDFREDDDDTFIVTNPPVDGAYRGKMYTLGVTVGGETVLYPFDELREAVGEVGIVQDEIGGEPVVLAFDLRTDTAALFSRRVGDTVAEFTAE